VKYGILFSLGSLLVEIVYVRISMVAMDWIRKQERLFKILEYVTLLIVVALGNLQFLFRGTSQSSKRILY